MKAKTRHWFIYQQPCFRFHIFAIHLIGVRIMPLAGRDGFNTTNIKSDGSFQSTRPLRGATVAGGDTKCMAGDFNPRAPCGARRQILERMRTWDNISIHAPREGRDPQASL